MAARRKYNWEGLFGRPCTVLVRGEDYHCSQSAMSAMVRNAASKLGVRVRLTDTGETIRVEVIGAIQHPDTTSVTC